MKKGYGIAIGIILVAAVVYISLFQALRLGEKISTSVLDLVPQDQRDPQLELARTLVQSDQNRVLLIALQSPRADEPLPAAARTAFIESLRASGCFTAVYDVAAEDYLHAASAVFFGGRGQLLLPAYLQEKRTAFDSAHGNIAGDAATTSADTGTDSANASTATGATAAVAATDTFSVWLARTMVADLDAFLDTPEAMAYQQLIPQDPQVLMLRAFEQWRRHSGDLAKKPPESLLTVWARLKDSPFSAQGQQPVFDALEAALEAASMAAASVNAAAADARLTPPEQLQMRTAGISRFAQANEQGIRREVTVFNIASVSLVLLICALLLRSPSVLFHTIALLAVSLPLAWLVTLSVFPSVPIIGLVIGSVLVGVTIDYCLHVFMAGRDTHEGPLLRPLLLSCGTTTTAFIALLLSPLPLLKQTGVFVAAGLVITCTLALLYKRLFGAHIHSRVRTDLHIRRHLPWKLPALLVLLALIPGIARISWNDSVDNLQYPLPQLRAEDTAVRALFGADEQAVYLSTGTDYASARDALEAFRNHAIAGSENAGATDIRLTDLAAWTPTLQQYLQAGDFFRTAPQFSQHLRTELEAGGYDAESFQPFFDALADWQQQPYSTQDYEALMQQLAGNLPGPIGNMLGGTDEMKFFLSVGKTGSGNQPAADTRTIKADSLYSLSGLFAHYRQNALSLSGYGLLAMVMCCLVFYGPRRGAQVLLVPLVAAVGALGTIGYLQGTLNLFHVIGLFLGVCLSLDYGAFALRNRGRASVPYSVCVAAATTISSFLLLTLSRIPAIVALGSTVTLCIVYGFITVVLLTISPRTPSASGAASDNEPRS